MNIDGEIDELLAKESGLKKTFRKMVYRAAAPLLSRLQDELAANEKSMSERLSQHDVAINQLNERVTNLEVNIRDNNGKLKDHGDYINDGRIQREKIFENILGINEELRKIKSSQEKLKKAAVNGTGAVVSDAKATADETTTAVAGTVVNTVEDAQPEDSYVGIDYFDFENRFRGSQEHIKAVQEQYLPYYEGKKNVVDIGCGRGEFLKILKEHNIKAVGIDLYGKAIDCCKLNDLEAYQMDAIEYLNGVKAVDGIFAGQLVEHMTIEQIITLCNTAYEKLEEGCYFIMETPNPTSLAIYTHAFYMDPSHVKPVHPLTLQYCAEKAGFSHVEIYYTDTSKLPVTIPKLSGDIENLEEFNNAMQLVSDTLFGSQDYAIIARK